MREFRTLGSVRGAARKGGPYRDSGIMETACFHDQTGVLMICEPQGGGWPIDPTASPARETAKAA